MKFKSESITSDPEILYNDHYAAIPMAVEVPAGGSVPSGTPIGKDGTVQNTADAVGILLYTVNEDDPNGAVVIHGFINEAKLPVTVTDAAKTAMKQIQFL